MCINSLGLDLKACRERQAYWENYIKQNPTQEED